MITFNRIAMVLAMLVSLVFSLPAFSVTQAENEQALKEFKRLERVVKRTQTSMATAKGEQKSIFYNRMFRAGIEQRDYLDQVMAYLEGEGKSDEPLKTQMRAVISQQSQSLKSNIGELEALINVAQKEGAKAESQVDKLIQEQRLIRGNEMLDLFFEALEKNIQYMNNLGLESAPDETFLQKSLSGYATDAADVIELLDGSQDDLDTLMSFADESVKGELKAKWDLISHRESGAISNLKNRVAMMERLGMDVTDYSQLLLRVTGELSGDVLDTDVIGGLMEDSAEAFSEWFSDNGVDLIWKVLLFSLIVLLFKILANVVKKLVFNALSRSKLNISSLLKEFFVSMSSKLVLLIGILIGLSQLGIQVGPLLAGLGMVGFIVGFALQDTLSNFASGMMILIYRPFDEGDLIETAGVTGTVSKLSLVSTTVLTLDNQCLVIPNSKIWGDVIRNVTAQTMRRIDMVFGIGYGDNIPHAEEVLNKIVHEHPKVLKSPEPMVKVHTLNESSVDFVVRPWVDTKDYWDVYWDVTKAVKQRFDAEGISIPFPQRDVHLYQTAVEKKD